MKKMTPKRARELLDGIRGAKEDPEVAHSLEDEMRDVILRSIANGTCTNHKECASIALTSNRLQFSRWCA